jgi:hypothetical protein
MRFKVEIVDFQTILPIWEEELWLGRSSEIKPMSSMTYLGGFDMEIYKNYKPTFFAVYNNADQIIGVNSGHRTSNTMYRSRGIWVNESYRNQGIAGILFCETFGQAMKEKCTHVWSVPRKNALVAYTKVGFKPTSEFFDEGMEFGPNCYVCAELDYDVKEH